MALNDMFLDVTAPSFSAPKPSSSSSPLRELKGMREDSHPRGGGAPAMLASEDSLPA